MIVLLVVVLAPVALLVSYRVQRARALKRKRADPAGTVIAGRAHGSAGRPERRQREARRLGYRYADDKIFIHGEGVFAGLVMTTSTDEFATPGEIADIAMLPVGMSRDLLGLFDGEGVLCHELVRYRPITTTGWLAQLLGQAWHPTVMYRVLAGKVAEHISNSSPQRMWALVVRLGDFPGPTGADPYAEVSAAVLGVAEERITTKDLTHWWARADNLHDVMARHGAEPLTRRDLLWLVRKPSYGHLPVPDAPVTRRRPWRGGFFELAATLRGRNLGGGYIELHRRDPDTGQDGTSFTATLVVADQPPRQLFNPRNPWARRLSKLTFPAEISWRYTLLPAKEWKRLADKAVANVEDERKDREKAGAEEDLAFEARQDQAEQIKADNSDGNAQPGMIGRLRITVSAPTLKLLARAVGDVKSVMGEIEMQVPEHAALPLLVEQLPGEDVSTDLGSLSAGPAGGISLWQRYSDTYQPAIGLLGSHNQVGDRIQVERGRALGWIGMVAGYVKSNGSVVHTDVHAQIGRGHGAGTAILGASGSGKTSYALLNFFWLSESGVRCSALDPKIDFANFVYYLSFGPQVLHPAFMDDADAGVLGTPASRFQPINRQFWDETEIVDLARGARGSQDPWRITRTFHDGYNLALDLTDVVFTEDAHRRIVRKGLRLMFAAYKQATADGQPFVCGYGDVLTYIQTERDELETDYLNTRKAGADTSSLRQARDEFDEVITRFENGCEVPFLRLLMGRGNDPGPANRGRWIRRVIYTMAGFKTPDHPDQPPLWTDADRNASAAMLAVLYRMRKENLSGRLAPNPITGAMEMPPTAAFVDEGNMVTAFAPGRGFLVVNLRQGRSLNSGLFFIDQQPRGVNNIEEEARKAGSPEVNQFGTVALFRQKSKSEALAGLELLRSSDDDVPSHERDALARNLQSEEVGGLLRPGDCALRDPDSRVAVTTVDQMFFVLQRAAQTNPVLKPIDWAIPVPADPHEWEINPEALMRVRTNVAAAIDHQTVIDPDGDEPGEWDGEDNRTGDDLWDADDRDGDTATNVDGDQPEPVGNPATVGAS